MNPTNQNRGLPPLSLNRLHDILNGYAEGVNTSDRLDMLFTKAQKCIEWAYAPSSLVELRERISQLATLKEDGFQLLLWYFNNTPPWLKGDDKIKDAALDFLMSTSNELSRQSECLAECDKLLEIATSYEKLSKNRKSDLTKTCENLFSTIKNINPSLADSLLSDKRIEVLKNKLLSSVERISTDEKKHILSFVDNKTLQNTAKVNKEWKRLTVEQFYQNENERLRGLMNFIMDSILDKDKNAKEIEQCRNCLEDFSNINPAKTSLSSLTNALDKIKESLVHILSNLDMEKDTKAMSINKLRVFMKSVKTPMGFDNIIHLAIVAPLLNESRNLKINDAINLLTSSVDKIMKYDPDTAFEIAKAIPVEHNSLDMIGDIAYQEIQNKNFKKSMDMINSLSYRGRIQTLLQISSYLLENEEFSTLINLGEMLTYGEFNRQEQNRTVIKDFILDHLFKRRRPNFKDDFIDLARVITVIAFMIPESDRTQFLLDCINHLRDNDADIAFELGKMIPGEKGLEICKYYEGKMNMDDA